LNEKAGVNMKENNLLPQCIICGKVDVNGIWIAGKIICLECERKIVRTEVENPSYLTYVAKLRSLRVREQIIPRQVERIACKNNLVYINDIK
jgi:hypothetical protein